MSGWNTWLSKFIKLYYSLIQYLSTVCRVTSQKCTQFLHNIIPYSIIISPPTTCLITFPCSLLLPNDHSFSLSATKETKQSEFYASSISNQYINYYLALHRRVSNSIIHNKNIFYVIFFASIHFIHILQHSIETEFCPLFHREKMEWLRTSETPGTTC